MPDLNELETFDTMRLADGTIAVRAIYRWVRFQLTPREIEALGLERQPVCLVCVPPDGE
jgi:hypothetical protein